MIKQNKSKYVLVIDTEQYAGNFERELCAYCTGQIGECEVGDDEAKVFHEEVPADPFVDKHGDSVLEQRPDDSGSPCLRPCAAWPTPGWFNTGMGGHFRFDDPEAESKALAAFKKANTENNEKYIAMIESYGRRLAAGEKVSTWTPETVDRDIARHRERIAEAQRVTSSPHYPAYLSVAIFFIQKPTAKQIKLIKARAKAFPAVRDARERRLYGKVMSGASIKITGFRLLEETTACSEKPV
jgi:hypothetical protein